MTAALTHITATTGNGTPVNLACYTDTAGLSALSAALPALSVQPDRLESLLAITPGSAAWDRLSVADKATIAQIRMQWRAVPGNPMAARCKSIVPRLDPQTGRMRRNIYTVTYRPESDTVKCSCLSKDCYHAETFRREWLPGIVDYLESVLLAEGRVLASSVRPIMRTVSMPGGVCSGEDF